MATLLPSLKSGYDWQMTTAESNAASEDEVWPCCFCGELTRPDARSDCYRCGEYFHLRMTVTADGPDCGDVWIDDETMALQFACRNCLDQQGSASAEPSAPSEPSAPVEPTTLDAPRPSVRRAAPGSSARDLARRRR